MKRIAAPIAAGLASILVHGGVDLLAAVTDALPAYLVPLSRESAASYLITFTVQAVVLVVAYVMVASRLPGESLVERSVAFGSVIFLFGVCLPLVPLLLVFREPMSLSQAVEALVGGAVVSFVKGGVFVIVWERVASWARTPVE